MASKTIITEFTVGRVVRVLVNETDCIEFPVSVKGVNPTGIERADIIKAETSMEDALLATLIRLHQLRGKQSDPLHVATTYGLGRAPVDGVKKK